MSYKSHDFSAENSEELLLKLDIDPTLSYDDEENYHKYLDNVYSIAEKSREPTESDVIGPYFRRKAPYRAKITPPYEPGTTMIISGRVWGIDTRRPLVGVIIDIWQANSEGHYDNEDPKHLPSSHSFKNRARIITDEEGSYEYETIHPGCYKMDEKTWRSPHIHYRVVHQNYKTLVTQLFFLGDPYEAIDPFFKKSLAINLKQEQINNNTIGNCQCSCRLDG